MNSNIHVRTHCCVRTQFLLWHGMLEKKPMCPHSMLALSHSSNVACQNSGIAEPGGLLYHGPSPVLASLQVFTWEWLKNRRKGLHRQLERTQAEELFAGEDGNAEAREDAQSRHRWVCHKLWMLNHKGMVITDAPGEWEGRQRDYGGEGKGWRKLNPPSPMAQHCPGRLLRERKKNLPSPPHSLQSFALPESRSLIPLSRGRKDLVRLLWRAAVETALLVPIFRWLNFQKWWRQKGRLAPRVIAASSDKASL